MADGAVFKIKINGDASSASAALKQIVAGLAEVDRVVTRVSKKTGSTSHTVTGSQQPQTSQQTTATAATAASTASVKLVNDAVNASKRLEQQNTKTAKATESVFTRIAKSYNNVISQFSRVANNMRYLSQGVQELGRAISYSIAAPLTLAFYDAYTTATNFESAMVRVQKTTQMEGETAAEASARVAGLAEKIRKFALYTSSSQVELAQFVEQLGQVGVTDTNALDRLMRVSEMLAVSTDLSSDTVAESMGRIAAAFGWNLNTETGVKNVESLADVINYLENTTAASAQQIVTGLLNVAAVGGMMDVPTEKLAVLVAYMESAGVRAEATGTRLSNWYTIIVGSTEEFAQMMRGYKDELGMEVYKDGQDVLDALNADPVKVMTDAMIALNTATDDTKKQQLANYFDVFGRVAGKTGVLQGSITNLNNALTKLEEGAAKGSLWREYNQALMTTEVHTKVLKNNINEVSIRLGSAFLPIINRLMEYAIPVIQGLANAFEGLDWSVKLAVVGIPLLAVALTPVLMLGSSVLHAMTLMAVGVAGTFKEFGTVVMGAGKVFSFVSSLVAKSAVSAAATTASASIAGGAASAAGTTMAIAPMWGLIGTIALVVGAVVLLFKALSSMGVNIGKWFGKLGTSAKTWGENLMKTFGGGILVGGVNYVAKAISAVAQMIARFFEAHSPPEEGPLSTIDTWGGGLMRTYLQGFMLADFDILSEVAGRIRQAFEGILDNLDSEGINNLVLGAREKISSLINIFNQTGEIAQNILSTIGDGLGQLGDDIEKLIQLSLEYKKIQEDLKKLEERKKQVSKNYGDEIRRISQMNISAEEKAALMRDAMLDRDEELRGIQDEQTALEEQADAKKEELDWQKAFVDAQLDQLDLTKKIQDSVGGLADALADVDFESMSNALNGFGDPVKEASDEMNALQQRIESARLVVQTFLMSLKGEDFDPLATMDPAALEQMKTEDPQGYADMVAELDKAKQLGGDLRSTLDGLPGPIRDMFVQMGLLNDKEKEVNDGFKNNPIATWANPIIDTITNILDPFAGLTQGFEDLKGNLDNVKESLNLPDWLTLQSVFEFLGKIITGLVLGALGILTGVFNGIGSAIGWVITLVGSLIETIVSISAEIVNFFDGFFQFFKGLRNLDPKDAKEGFEKMKDALMKLLPTIMQTILKFLAQMVFGLFASISDILLTTLGGIAVSILKILGLDSAAEDVANWVAGAKTWLKQAWDDLTSFFGNTSSDEKSPFEQWLEQAWVNVGAWFAQKGVEIQTWWREDVIKGVQDFGTNTAGPFAQTVAAWIVGAIGQLLMLPYKVRVVLTNFWQGVHDWLVAKKEEWSAKFNEWVTAGTEKLAELAVNAPAKLSEMLNAAITWFANLGATWVQQFNTWVSSAITALGGLGTQVGTPLAGMLTSIGTWFTTNLSPFLDNFLSWIKAIPKALGDFFSQILPDALQKVADFFNEIVTQINNWFASIGDFFSGDFVMGSVDLQVTGNGGGGSGNGGGGSSNGSGGGSVRGFATGAIISGPQLAVIGEGGEDEAVLPLSKLPGIINSVYADQLAFAGAGIPEQAVNGGTTIVEINNPVVREDKDIDRLVNEVTRALEKRAKGQARYGRR